MGKKLASIENKIRLPFIYLLMDPSVPFEPEKTRYFEKEKRLEFFKKIKEKLEFHNARYTLIKGSWSSRTTKAEKIIKNALLDKIEWSRIRD